MAIPRLRAFGAPLGMTATLAFGAPLGMTATLAFGAPLGMTAASLLMVAPMSGSRGISR
jgi:hypothetical protein